MKQPRARVADSVLQITLPGTPLDAALARALYRLLPSPEDLEASSVVLITSAGDDVAPLGDRKEGEALPPGLCDGGPGGDVAFCIDALANLDAVTVLALSGNAQGCGAELAIACDLRIAAARAHIWFPHLRFGRMPACGATQRLPRLIGPGPAFRALMLQEGIGGEAMVRLGLAASLADSPDGAIAQARELAITLAQQSAPALRACKEAVLGGGDLPLREGLRLEADLAVLLQSTHDRAEGLRAFLEKRPPRFTGD